MKDRKIGGNRTIIQTILEGLGGLLILVCAVGIRKGAVGIDMHHKSKILTLLQQRESLSQIIRNESGSIPNSFTNNLIFNFFV